jgi:hypothetical protein
VVQGWGQVQINPGLSLPPNEKWGHVNNNPAVGHELARLGFFQSGCHAALIGESDLDVSAPTEIVVEPVTSAEQMEGSSELMSWAVAFRKPRTINLRKMSDPGLFNRVGSIYAWPLRSAAGIGALPPCGATPLFHPRIRPCLTNLSLLHRSEKRTNACFTAD